MIENIIKQITKKYFYNIFVVFGFLAVFIINQLLIIADIVTSRNKSHPRHLLFMNILSIEKRIFI